MDNPTSVLAALERSGVSWLWDMLDRLKSVRGMDWEDLSRVSGVSRGTTLRVKNGHTIRRETLFLLLSALHRASPLSSAEVSMIAGHLKIDSEAISRRLEAASRLHAKPAAPAPEPTDALETDFARLRHMVGDAFVARLIRHQLELAEHLVPITTNEEVAVGDVRATIIQGYDRRTGEKLKPPPEPPKRSKQAG